MQGKIRVKEPEAAEYIGMSRAWLRLKRSRGQRGGPPYLKIAKSVLYDVRDLDRWLAEHRREYPEEAS